MRKHSIEELLKEYKETTRSIEYLEVLLMFRVDIGDYKSQKVLNGEIKDKRDWIRELHDRIVSMAGEQEAKAVNDLLQEYESAARTIEWYSCCNGMDKYSKTRTKKIDYDEKMKESQEYLDKLFDEIVRRVKENGPEQNGLVCQKHTDK